MIVWCKNLIAVKKKALVVLIGPFFIMWAFKWLVTFITFSFFEMWLLIILCKGTFMFLPLFVAVILRQFQDETSAENFTVNPARIDEFRKVWQKFDPYLFIINNNINNYFW